MKNSPANPPAHPRRYKIQVAHPKSGAESSIIINASNAEEAGRLANAAGLLVCAVTPVIEETDGPDHGAMFRQTETNSAARQTPERLGVVESYNYAKWAYKMFGLGVLVLGLIWAIIIGNESVAGAIGAILFIRATFAAYKWYWQDQGPWR